MRPVELLPRLSPCYHDPPPPPPPPPPAEESVEKPLLPDADALELLELASDDVVEVTKPAPASGPPIALS